MLSFAPVGSLITAQPIALVQTGARGLLRIHLCEWCFRRTQAIQKKKEKHVCVLVRLHVCLTLCVHVCGCV